MVGCYAPGTVLSVLPVINSLILMKSLGDRHYSTLTVWVKKLEAQSG